MVKEDKAEQSNLTVAVSFGLEREAAFEHAKTKTVVSMAAPNGSAYVFARDINMIWRHGILQVIVKLRSRSRSRLGEGKVTIKTWT